MEITIKLNMHFLCGQVASSYRVLLSEVGGKHVVELFHRDLVVVVRVKAPEKSVLLVVGDVDVH